MSKNSDRVKKWRNETKKRIVESFGGGCSICGYNKCQSALALHHLDPSKKEITFGKIRANPKNWNKIVSELRKCILVCHNCHSEIHESIVEIPSNVIRFNEEYMEYKKTSKQTDECPVCGNEKNITRKTCSSSCNAKTRYNVDWDSINLMEEIKNKTYTQIAEELGCSANAVRKRVLKSNPI